MRRKLLLSLVLILALSIGSAAFAQLESKLEGHWAKNEIDKTFMAYYFPYMAKNSFEGFEPNTGTTKQDFNLSLISLFKDRGYEVFGLGDPGILTRNEMASAIGSRLVEAGFSIDSSYQLPFTDLGSMSEANKGYLSLLHQLGIVKGESNSVFSPVRRLTQAEAVVLLQRLDGILKKQSEISFQVVNSVQSYDSQEEMTTMIGDDKVTLLITKEFPSPGYSIEIQRIERDNELFRIHFKINQPDPDMMYPQVITYQTLTVEIPRSELGEPPYNFVVEGFRTTSELR